MSENYIRITKQRLPSQVKVDGFWVHSCFGLPVRICPDTSDSTSVSPLFFLIVHRVRYAVKRSRTSIWKCFGGFYVCWIQHF